MRPFMWIASVLALLLQIFAAGPCAVAENPDPAAARETSRVVAVATVDGLQIQTRGKTELVVLYGVKSSLLRAINSKPAKKEVEQLLQGKNILLERRSKLGGLPLVVAYLEDGLCVNEYVIAQGLAEWDRAVAPDYERAAGAEEQARTAHLGIWRTEADNAQASQDAPSAASALQQFKRRNEFKKQASFDASFEKWTSLDQSQQFAAISALRSVLDENDAAADGAFAELDQASRDVESRDAAARDRVKDSKAELKDLRTEELRQLRQIRDEHPTRFGRKIYEPSQRTAVSIASDARQIKMDSIDVQEDYGQRKAEKAAQIRAAENEQKVLELAKVGLDIEAQNAENKHAALQYSVLAEINLLGSMSRAAREGYVPVIGKKEIEYLSDPKDDSALELEIDSDVWRIDIQTPGNVGIPDLSVDVSRNASSPPFTRLLGDAPLLSRSIILDGPGTFSLRIRNPEDYACSVLVYTLN